MRHLRHLRYVDEVARTGSMRRAAERLNVTASALNRRIRDIEEELGTPLFERLARGVRLNAAGEILVHHIRRQLADVDRMRSRIEDLAALRRGTVSIASSQAVAYRFLPAEIAAYRAQFPQVTFRVDVRDHLSAVVALETYEADLALVFGPQTRPSVEALIAVPQRLVAVMPAGHPLARHETVRLRDLVQTPLALPETGIAGRRMLDAAQARLSGRLEPVVESNSFEFLRAYLRHEEAVSVQIEIGTPQPGTDPDLAVRPIDPRDVPPGDLVLAQLRGRPLPVAAAKFAEQIARSLDAAAPT